MRLAARSSGVDACLQGEHHAHLLLDAALLLPNMAFVVLHNPWMMTSTGLQHCRRTIRPKSRMQTLPSGVRSRLPG